jgi:hypothetical protein
MTTATGSEPKTSGRVEANGVDYYYEIHGQGEPLLLLHAAEHAESELDGVHHSGRASQKARTASIACS